MDSKHQRRFVRQSCRLILLSLIPTAALLGQEAQNAAAPNIKILKIHWEKQVRLPRNFDPSIIPTGNSFNDPASMTSVSISSTDTKTPNPVRIGSANVFPSIPGRLPVYYVYSLKIRNSGKRSEGVAWDYLFLDPGSHNELGSHQFVSYTKISSDKAVTLQGQLRSPPIRVVPTSESSQKSHPKFLERVVIQCVLYADDATWKNTNAREDVCDSLKNGKPLLKRKRSAG